MIPKFIKLMLNGKKPTIFGDGKQTRDFSFIANVIEGNMMAMKAKSEACGREYNIACSERITLLKLVEEINGILGMDISPVHAAEREGDVKHSFADISLAKEHLEYNPSVMFREGLERTVEWFKSH